MQELSENFNAEVNYKQINVRISFKKSTTNMDTKYLYRAPSPLKKINILMLNTKKVRYLSYGRGTKKHKDYFVCEFETEILMYVAVWL